MNMAWIEEAESADPTLPEIFRVMSLDPNALQLVKDLNEGLSFGGSGLARVQEEAIATVVSAANRCRYGGMTHGGFLRRQSGDAQLVSDILQDYTVADLSDADRAMLGFALKLTLRPYLVTREDVEALREVGYEDREILSIVLTTCLINFMNRLADGLGIDVPPDYQKSVMKWLTGPAAVDSWLVRPKRQ
jgi:uncharacterized peroxidase-related enzyme